MRIALFIILLAGLVAVRPSAVLAAGPTPAPPAQEVTGGFVRFIPDSEGNYEWKMEGETVSFLSPVQLAVTRLTATALAPRLGDLTIEAARMLYSTDTRIARDDEARVTVRRENSVLTGRGYLWTPARQQIRIFEDVRLLIREEGEGGLFPR